jgi:hypothetical protein
VLGTVLEAALYLHMAVHMFLLGNLKQEAATCDKRSLTCTVARRLSKTLINHHLAVDVR